MKRALLLLVGGTLISGAAAWTAATDRPGHVAGLDADPADQLAAFERTKELARDTRALVVIPRDPAVIAKLPAFPKAAD